jgi:hypothetical protein
MSSQQQIARAYEASDVDLANELFQLFCLRCQVEIPKSRTDLVESVLIDAAKLIHQSVLPAITKATEAVTSCRDHWKTSFEHERVNVIRLLAERQDTERLDWLCMNATKDFLSGLPHYLAQARQYIDIARAQPQSSRSR